MSQKPRTRARILAWLIRILLVLAALLCLLPFAAIARALVIAITGGVSAGNLAGMFLSLFALLLGSVFFLYSVRYYLATVVVLLSSLVLSTNNGDSHHSAGNGPHKSRILRRGNGNGNGKKNGSGNGNGNGRLDLGYEPFVSIHVASYNEKRVIGRLLEACAALEYGNYEVVLVDDSTDETASILEPWKGNPRFKIIHRATRDGFKGGALEVALAHTDSRAEFVLVWDADVVPFSDSIQTFLPHFFNGNGNGNGNGHGNGSGRRELRPEVAAVQSYQWHVLNRSESWLTEAVRAEYAGSYMVERPFQEFVGSLKMIAGTAYMIRAPILRQLGWGRSLTEDWELTLRLHLLGLKVVYTPYAESPAECVGTFGRLARQRMRWAEGHTHNVRRWWWQVLRSRNLTAIEKIDFLYHSTYYLQAAFFTVGTSAWLIAELAIRTHVPEWTSTFGWALLLTNMLALPLMNLAGLLLEGAPGRDFMGILGALATSFLLIPFQTYAALKGLFERDEGPWYRTPKTGRITDPIHHLRRLGWLRRWRGRSPQSRKGGGVTHPATRIRAKRHGWVVVGAMAALLGALAFGAWHAPTAQAAGSNLFLHGLLGPFTMDNTAPTGGLAATFLLAPVNTTRTWATTSSTAAAQTVFTSTSFTFNYSTTGVGGSTGVNLVFGFSAASSCASVTTVAQTSTTLTSGSNLSTASFSPASNVTVPAGSFFCFKLTVTSIGVVDLTLNSDASSAQTNLSSTQTIFIPELALPLAIVALVLPAATRVRRRPS